MTTSPVDLSPLFSTPQIHTDEHGRHWDDQGHELVAVDVDGELTFAPIPDPATARTDIPEPRGCAR